MPALAPRLAGNELIAIDCELKKPEAGLLGCNALWCVSDGSSIATRFTEIRCKTEHFGPKTGRIGIIHGGAQSGDYQGGKLIDPQFVRGQSSNVSRERAGVP